MSAIPQNYFSEKTLSHLKPQQGLLERYQWCDWCDAGCQVDANVWQVSSDHASQTVSHERGMDYLSTSRTAGGNDESDEHLPFLTIGLHAHAGGEHRRIYRHIQGVQAARRGVCRRALCAKRGGGVLQEGVWGQWQFHFFKPFCNLYFSVYADALLMYQQGKIDYSTFCWEFQELSWMDGRRTPLDGKRLKMYIMSMRKVVEAYKKLLCWTN